MQYISERLSKKCRENNLRVGFMMTTNGTIFNNEIAKFIGKFRPSISISIDGPEPIHNKNRKRLNGQGSFSKASATGLLLQAMPIMLFARLTFNAETVNYLSDSIEYLINQGYKIVKPVPDFYSEWDDSALKELELQLLNIFKLQYKYPEVEITILKPYIKPSKKIPCQGAGVYEVNILPDGSLYPCTQVSGISKFKIGDVANGIDAPTLIQQHRDNMAITRDACSDCKYFAYCDSGRCTYVNYRMTGRLDMASKTYCSINRALFLTAEKILGSYGEYVHYLMKGDA